MQKINIIKFSPYFPPHKGGLETHIEQWSKYYVQKGYGKVFNITSSIGQENINLDIIDNYKNQIGYIKNGYEVLIIPCFDLIYGFPFPMLWKKSFWRVISYIKQKINEDGINEKIYVHTHTRFFLTSLLGGIFAKSMGIKWIHIEHGVDYVKLNSKIKSFFSYIYDMIIGRSIFVFSDRVIAISNGCKEFSKKFTKKNIEVIHRGIEFPMSILDNSVKENKSTSFSNGKIIIGFIGRLVKLKGVDLLINAFIKIKTKYKDYDIELLIIGDGDELLNLKKIVKNNDINENIKFLGFQQTNTIYSELLPKINILVNPSFQEGLPTSVIEGLLSCSVVIATNVGGTSEISDEKDMILIKSGNENDIYNGLTEAIKNYNHLIGLSKNTVIKRFDWNNSISKYYTYFKSI